MTAAPDDHADRPANAGRMSRLVPAHGRLESPADRDVFHLRLDRPGTFALHRVEVDGGGDRRAVRVDVLAADGKTVVLRNVVLRPGQRGAPVKLKAGTYFVRVSRAAASAAEAMDLRYRVRVAGAK